MARLPHPAIALLLLLVFLSTQVQGQAQQQVDPQAVRRRIETHRAAYVRTNATLAIRDLQPPQQPIPAFARLQVDFDVAGSYANPFDPDQITVDGVITRPDGRTVTVPAYYTAPYTPANGLTQMTTAIDMRPDGAPRWRLRFTPDTPGDYRLQLTARTANGQTATSDPQQFTVTPSKHPGFVRAAAGNPMYFENSGDGSLFWGVGSNVAWTRGDEGKRGIKGPPAYEHYFGRAEGKMNATRVWLCHWAWLEWTPQRTGDIWPGYAGAGYYNQQIAAVLDRVFELAEAKGLRIMLVTEDNDETFSTGPAVGTWPAHPYNQVNGGPCEKPHEMFTSPDSRRLYRNRMRYIVARWGYSPSLWAINSMNDSSNPSAAQLNWIKDIHQYIHGLFDGYRPIIYGTNLGFAADDVVDYRQAGRGPVAPDKPNVTQECYYTAVPESFRAVLHEQLWAGLARGLGAIMVWDHVLVDRTDAWDEFLPLLRFVEDLPLHKHAWQPLQPRILTATADAAGPYPRASELRPYGDVPVWGVRPPNNRFAFDLTQAHQWMEGYSPTIWGDRGDRQAWRNPPIFEIDLPADGTLLLEVTEIGGGTNELRITRRANERDDWSELRTIRYTDGRRSTTTEERWLELPLPKGRHQVMLDCAGDWLRVSRVVATYPMTNAASLVNASGWTDGRHAFLYLENQTRGRLLHEVLKQSPVGLTRIEMELPGLADGPYRVEICDTTTGQPISSAQVTAQNGRLPLNLPALQHDAAIKVLPTTP